MAQLSSIAALLSTVGTVASLTQGQRRDDGTRAAEAARAAQLQAANEEERRRRAGELRRTIASTRARLAAGGVTTESGSGAALVQGLEDEAAQRDQNSTAVLQERIASGRASLLDGDGGLQPFLRVGRSVAGLGSSFRNLLD